MPIVINEIEISVEVIPSTGVVGGDANNSSAPTEQIVKECVEKVMELINLKNER